MENGGGNTDSSDESNKGEKNPPSKTKQRVHLSFLHPEDYENTPSETKQRAIVFANAAVHQNFAADYMPPVFPAVVGRNYFLHPEDPAAFQYTGVWVTATNPAVVGRTYYNHYSAPRDEVTEESSEKDKGDVTYDNWEGGRRTKEEKKIMITRTEGRRTTEANRIRTMRETTLNLLGALMAWARDVPPVIFAP